MPKWDRYTDEYEREDSREAKRNKVRKPKKLNYKQAKQLKEAKRKARLAQRRTKKLLSSESLGKEEVKTHDIKKTITLEDLTNPNQK